MKSNNLSIQNLHEIEPPTLGPTFSKTDYAPLCCGSFYLRILLFNQIHPKVMTGNGQLTKVHS